MTPPDLRRLLTRPRGLEALAHISSWVAVSLTVLMVGTGQVAESNPVAGTLMNTLGMTGFALLTPVLISILYRLLHRFADRHVYFALPAGLLVADAIGNLAVIAYLGIPQTMVPVRHIGVMVSVGCIAVLLFGRIPRPLTAIEWCPENTADCRGLKTTSKKAR